MHAICCQKNPTDFGYRHLVEGGMKQTPTLPGTSINKKCTATNYYETKLSFWGAAITCNHAGRCFFTCPLLGCVPIKNFVPCMVTIKKHILKHRYLDLQKRHSTIGFEVRNWVNIYPLKNSHPIKWLCLVCGNGTLVS